MPDLSVTAMSPRSTALQPVAAAQSVPSLSFHELLSDLNPLQYIPVIGTIYRSVTGDTIPDSVRIIGSLVFSGLTGGPVGLATNAAMLALEKVTGIDPEEIGHNVLASIGIGTSESTTASVSSAPAASGSGTTMIAASDAQSATTIATSAAPTGTERPIEAWSASQLTAYGVVRTANGTLRRGNLVDSDVLNDLELARNRNRDSSGTALATL